MAKKAYLKKAYLRKVYFIGIAGKTMAPLAKAFKGMGWEVSGSDQKNVYPPISTYLRENKIPYIKGYDARNVPKDANLVIIGRSARMIDLDNPEYLEAKKLSCPVMSFPEAFEKYLIKENSVVVAGSFGKTTTSAIITWILKVAGKNPSYMISDIPINFPDGIQITNSGYSVTEGDECPALGPCDLPKFMYYKPKYLLLTATIWDHPEVYKSEEQYLKAFIELVKLLPEDGILVYELENVRPEVAEQYPSRKISYSFDSTNADCYVKNYSIENGKTKFTISFKNQEIDLETILIGKHNLQNICGAVAMSLELGIDSGTIKKALKTFKGVKSRLELLGKFGGRYLFSDIAQFQEKVKGSLLALRDFFPESRIICVFNPFATALKFRESLQWYSTVFDSADQVIVSKVSFLKEIPKEQRVTGSDIVGAIGETQPKVFYEPVDEKLIGYLTHQTKEGDIIVFMSSGGLRFSNLIEEITQKFQGVEV
ncbi:MAG TPA: Mur ligase family protein [Patescibacteria group bacterium]|nr:Mur ligase family protein [Patescibacteria group bacterium]